MAETTSETKFAIISISNALLGISFADLAAFGGASNPALAAALAIPSVTLAASGSLKPLLDQLKGKKEGILELPIPNWWSRRDDASWQDACTSLESRLPTIVNATAKQLQQEKRPTSSVILHVFIKEIEQQIPQWGEISTNERSLMASYVAKPFLERVAAILKTKTDPLQMDALIVKLDELNVKMEAVADAIVKLSTQAPDPSTTRAIPSAPAAVTSPSGRSALSPAEVLERKWQAGEYDVFICYHPGDKDEVKKIDEQLKAKAILPWFDVRQELGTASQREIIQQLEALHVAAVFIGEQAETAWQGLQTEAFIEQFVQRNIRVIPVFLPTAPDKLEFSRFLDLFSGVDFRETEPDPFAYLMWGITGKRPRM